MEQHFKNKAYIAYKYVQIVQGAQKLELLEDSAIAKKCLEDITFIDVVVERLNTFISSNSFFVERSSYVLLLHHVVDRFVQLLHILIEKQTSTDKGISNSSLGKAAKKILSQQIKTKNYLEQLKSEGRNKEHSQFGASESELEMLIKDFTEE